MIMTSSSAKAAGAACSPPVPRRRRCCVWCYDKSNLKKERLAWLPVVGDTQSIMEEKAAGVGCEGEQEGIGHMANTVRKHKETDAGTLLLPPFI